MKRHLARIVPRLALACLTVGAPYGAYAAEPADADRQAAAREMVDAMHLRDMTKAMLRAQEALMPDQMVSTLKMTIQNDTSMNADQKRDVEQKIDAMRPKFAAQAKGALTDDAIVDQITAMSGPIYASGFSAAELRQLTAFYRSPVGQKSVAAMPVQSAQLSEVFGKVLAPRILKLTETMAQGLGTQ